MNANIDLANAMDVQAEPSTSQPMFQYPPRGKIRLPLPYVGAAIFVIIIAIGAYLYLSNPKTAAIGSNPATYRIELHPYITHVLTPTNYTPIPPYNLSASYNISLKTGRNDTVGSVSGTFQMPSNLVSAPETLAVFKAPAAGNITIQIRVNPSRLTLNGIAQNVTLMPSQRYGNYSNSAGNLQSSFYESPKNNTFIIVLNYTKTVPSYGYENFSADEGAVVCVNPTLLMANGQYELRFSPALFRSSHDMCG
jgi:hypothetical protein